MAVKGGEPTISRQELLGDSGEVGLGYLGTIVPRYDPHSALA
jgi:hypothetical protein